MTVRSKLPTAILCDVDGTLVDVSSIRHYVVGTKNPDGSYTTKDFDAFHRNSINCPPIVFTLDLLDYHRGMGHEIVIVTARSDKYQEQTRAWLETHGVHHHDLYMRAEGDYRADYDVKKDIFSKISQRWTVVGAIDDNPNVLALWNELCIPTTVIPGWMDDE